MSGQHFGFFDGLHPPCLICNTRTQPSVVMPGNSSLLCDGCKSKPYPEVSPTAKAQLNAMRGKVPVPREVQKEVLEALAYLHGEETAMGVVAT